MGKKERMKNGLDALFEDNFHEAFEKPVEEAKDSIKMVRISLLEPNKNQPRREFDQTKLLELASNIAQHGVLQPILVRPMENGGYQIVAGERRWRASRLAELKEVPVYIKDLTDFQVAQVALVENLQRENLNPVEEAEAYNRLCEEFRMTHEDIARTVGKSRSQISNSLRLLKLSDEVKNLLKNGDISSGHAKIIASIEDKEKQTYFANTAVEKEMTVRAFEKFVSEENVVSAKQKKKKAEERKKADDPYLTEVKLALEKEYGRKTVINKGKKGEIVMQITFSDMDDFKSQMSKLKE
ncbi:MAG: ParB/RepB/Spo0J family partition protein [Ruminococcus sp.]|nr:ParB/RepB/Spo0J family partition protein [Ruminococcus sp.]